MSAELLRDLSRASDSNNAPLAGAYWVFSATETTTPQAVYADADLSTSLGATVTADGAGEFADIYMDASLIYRGRLYNAGGTLLRDVDPISSNLVRHVADATTAEARTLQVKAQEWRSILDYAPLSITNLAGNFADALAGDDLTAAIQKAMDWVDGGDLRGILVPGFARCGNVDVASEAALLGQGRQGSGFIANTGTTGLWWTAPDSAQKVILDGLVWNANGEAIDRIMDLTTGQAGTEGHIKDCWFRGAYDGHGLYCNGNVYYIRNSTFESCKFPAKILGACNQLSGITIMQPGFSSAAPTAAIGLDITGFSFVRGLHVEAPANGSLPISMRGDCHLTDVMMSLTAGYTFSHLIEIDNAGYQDWTLKALQILPNPQTVTITNGVVKVGANYRLGTNTVSASGGPYGADSVMPAGSPLKDQAFMVQMHNNGGTIRHRIGAIGPYAQGDTLTGGTFHDRITSASQTFANSPTGADASTATASGLKISATNTNALVLNTNAQIAGDLDVMADISFNDTGTAYTIRPAFTSRDVNGTTRVRLELQLLNATTGAAVAWSAALASGNTININVRGRLA